MLPSRFGVEFQTRLVNLGKVPSVDAAIVKYFYVLEDRVGWFDAFSPAFAVNGDDRRAIPGIVRPKDGGEREPKHSARNAWEFRGDLRGTACIREFAGLFRSDHSRS